MTLRQALRFTHGMRNDGERGGPKHLYDRCSYRERKESAQIGLAVLQDRRIWRATGILPDYVKKPVDGQMAEW